MSSSRQGMPMAAGPDAGTGRVFMGADTPGPDEMTIQELEGKRKLVWDGQTDEEYFLRVRAKAQTMAKDILARAMAEAEEIKAKAHGQGMEQGLTQGQAQVDAYVAQLAASAEGVLSGVQAQARDLWRARGDDFTTLVRVVVEKVLGIEMAERRQEMLHALLTEALDKLDSQRQVLVRVNPQDVELIGVLLNHAQSVNPGLGAWRVKADEGIDLGGVILETPDGRVENTLDARWQAVAPLLEQLSVEAPAQDAPAFTAPPTPDPLADTGADAAQAQQPEPEDDQILAPEAEAEPEPEQAAPEVEPEPEPEQAAATEPEPGPEPAPEPEPDAEDMAPLPGEDDVAPLTQDAVEAMLAQEAMQAEASAETAPGEAPLAEEPVEASGEETDEDSGEDSNEDISDDDTEDGTA